MDGTPCPPTDVREGAYLRCPRELTTTSRPRCPCEDVALAVWAEQRIFVAERRAARASSRDPVATALGLTGGWSLGTLLGGFLLGWDAPATRFTAFWAATSLVWVAVALAVRARRS